MTAEQKWAKAFFLLGCIWALALVPLVLLTLSVPNIWAFLFVLFGYFAWICWGIVWKKDNLSVELKMFLWCMPILCHGIWLSFFGSLSLDVFINPMGLWWILTALVCLWFLAGNLKTCLLPRKKNLLPVRMTLL